MYGEEHAVACNGKCIETIHDTKLPRLNTSRLEGLQVPDADSLASQLRKRDFREPESPDLCRHIDLKLAKPLSFDEKSVRCFETPRRGLRVGFSSDLRRSVDEPHTNPPTHTSNSGC